MAYQTKVLRLVCFAIVLLSADFGLVADPQRVIEMSHCPSPEPLTLNSTFRKSRVPSTSSDHFQVSLIGPGVLSLDVSTLGPGATSSLATVSVSTSCLIGQKQKATLLQETPQGLLLRIEEAMNVHLAVGPQDPSAHLEDYKLRSAFIPDPVVTAEVIRLEEDPPAACGEKVPTVFSTFGSEDGTDSAAEDTVDPWDCDVIGGLVDAGALILTAEGVPVEVSLLDAECGENLAGGVLSGSQAMVAAAVHPGEHRLTVDSVGISGAYALHMKHYPLCSRGEHDDHGDTPLCASRLDVDFVAQGELANDYGDDEDFFTFRLASQEAVAFDIVSDSGLYCQLFDQAGQRLLEWADCGGPDSRPIVRTLGEGRYFLSLGDAGRASASFTARIDFL